jgi:hypothetical protein
VDTLVTSFAWSQFGNAISGTIQVQLNTQTGYLSIRFPV